MFDRFWSIFPFYTLWNTILNPSLHPLKRKYQPEMSSWKDLCSIISEQCKLIWSQYCLQKGYYKISLGRHGLSCISLQNVLENISHETTSNTKELKPDWLLGVRSNHLFTLLRTHTSTSNVKFNPYTALVVFSDINSTKENKKALRPFHYRKYFWQKMHVVHPLFSMIKLTLGIFIFIWRILVFLISEKKLTEDTLKHIQNFVKHLRRNGLRKQLTDSSR